MLFAGTVADVDLLSLFFGPAAYFHVHRTYTHSLLGTFAVILLALIFTRYLARSQPEATLRLLTPLALAAVLHVVLDVFQSEGVTLFWPFRPTRFALDWLPAIDPWILVLLLAGILIPELLRLVSSEIGAKNKSPRGRNGAVVALSVIALYIAARALLHSGSVAALEPHSYHGESARTVASFPDAFSILTWHGVVETQSLLCTVEIPMGWGRNFDAGGAECLHKPEPSPELSAAQKTRLSQIYLQAVPLPRAAVAKTADGYEAVIRSMRDLAENETRHRVAAHILLDQNYGVSGQELIWVRDVHLR